MLFNPRGTNGSDPPPDGRYELDGYAADLDALRAHLGLERFDLLGHSHGGFVGLTYALAHPDRLRRLILCCSAPRFSDELRAEAAEAWSAHPGEPWFEEARQAMCRRQGWEFESPEEAGALYGREVRLWFSADSPAARRFTAEFARRRLDLEALRYFNERLAPDYNLTPRLGEIRIPTLVLNGAADFFGPRVSARELGTIPGSRTVLIEDAGHMPFAEQPEAFRLHVEAFLDD